MTENMSSSDVIWDACSIGNRGEVEEMLADVLCRAFDSGPNSNGRTIDALEIAVDRLLTTEDVEKLICGTFDNPKEKQNV